MSTHNEPEVDRDNQEKKSGTSAKPMTESGQLVPDKKNGELLQKQVEFNYMNFDRRRSYEWKLSIALWTAIAAFIALSLRGDAPIQITGWRLVAAIIPVTVIVLLQVYFLAMILEANNLDKEKSWYYEKALNIFMHTDWEDLDDESSKNLSEKMKKFNDSKYRLSGRWPYIVEAGITVVLLLSAIGVLYMKTETKHPSSQVYKLSLALEKRATTETK
jgi:hypothetical protein